MGQKCLQPWDLELHHSDSFSCNCGPGLQQVPLTNDERTVLHTKKKHPTPPRQRPHPALLFLCHHYSRSRACFFAPALSFLASTTLPPLQEPMDHLECLFSARGAPSTVQSQVVWLSRLAQVCQTWAGILFPSSPHCLELHTLSSLPELQFLNLQRGQ